MLGYEFAAVTLLLGAPHRRGNDVHPEPPELVLYSGKPRLGGGELGDGDHDADVLFEHVPVPGHHGGEECVVVRGVGQVKAHPRRGHDIAEERLGQRGQQVLLVGEVAVEHRG